MFRIKRFLAAIACLLTLSACAESLIPESMIQDEKTHYDTLTLQPGTFEITVSGSATEFYPATRVLRCEQSGARFGEYLVERNQQVKKGDVLAVFSVEFDESALEECRVQLLRAQEGLERDTLAAREELEEMELALLQAEAARDRAVARLKIERAEIELARLTDSRSRQMQELEDKIAELEQIRDDNQLIAPMDGVVSEIEFKREGEPVQQGEKLITLQREDIMLLAVENPDGAFRYGMEVTVEYGANKQRAQAPGRVVCADWLIPMEERSGYALIEFEYDGKEKLSRIAVEAAQAQVQDALLVPRRAVALDGGRRYVTQLIDGVPQKRFVNCVFVSSAQDVWVLQGLQAGDEIVLN